MCDHSTPEQQLLRIIEDWLLVAHPDAVHDLERHLSAVGSELRAAELLNMLSAANRHKPHGRQR